MKPITIVPSFEDLDRADRERDEALREGVMLTLTLIARAVLEPKQRKDDHLLWLLSSHHRPYIWVEPLGRHRTALGAGAGIVLRTDDRELPVTVEHNFMRSLQPDAFRPGSTFLTAVEREIRETVQRLERNT